MAKQKDAAKKAAAPAKAAAPTEPSKGKRVIVNKAVKITQKQLAEEAANGSKRAALVLLARAATSIAVENGADGIEVGYKKTNITSKVEHATRVRNELAPEMAATEKGRSGILWQGDDEVIAPIVKLAKAAAPDIAEEKYTANIKNFLNAILAARPVRERKEGTGKTKGPTNRQKAIDYAAFL